MYISLHKQKNSSFIAGYMSNKQIA